MLDSLVPNSLTSSGHYELCLPPLCTQNCSISSDRHRINSAFLAYSLLGVGYFADGLAGQINSMLLMPPLRERGETKVVQPFIGIDRLHIQSRKAVEV